MKDFLTILLGYLYHSHCSLGLSMFPATLLFLCSWPDPFSKRNVFRIPWERGKCDKEDITFRIFIPGVLSKPFFEDFIRSNNCWLGICFRDHALSSEFKEIWWVQVSNPPTYLLGITETALQSLEKSSRRSASPCCCKRFSRMIH